MAKYSADLIAEKPSSFIQRITVVFEFNGDTDEAELAVAEAFAFGTPFDGVLVIDSIYAV